MEDKVTQVADSLPWERLREIANPYLREPASGFEEIGDGNLNYIYRVWSATDSVIVKHALDYIRISHGARPLTIDRTMYEARALAVSDTLAPGRVPRVHTVIADSGILVMEDLRHHRTLRSLCLSPDVGHERLDLVGEFLARTHLQTSAVLLAPEERAAYVTEFINPDMVRHTLGVTFRRPFAGRRSAECRRRSGASVCAGPAGRDTSPGSGPRLRFERGGITAR